MEEMKHLYKCNCHTNMCKSLQRTLEAHEEIMITATFAAVPTRLPFHSEIFTFLYVVYACNNARYTNLKSVKRCKTRKNSNHNTDISLTWRDERILADDNDKWKRLAKIFISLFLNVIIYFAYAWAYEKYMNVFHLKRRIFFWFQRESWRKV